MVINAQLKGHFGTKARRRKERTRERATKSWGKGESPESNGESYGHCHNGGVERVGGEEPLLLRRRGDLARLWAHI
jgi:hypothetical protein